MSEWGAVEAALTGILDRRWYTNHGPLARRLEDECAAAARVRHAIAVTNPTIGLIMLAEALALTGEVMLSALAPARCARALAWAGLTPRYVDIDPETLGVHAAAITAAVGPATAAFCATGPADLAACPSELLVYGEGLVGEVDPVLVDLRGLGDDAGSAVILTDRDDLAARLRNIRSSYGAGEPVAVVRTANGRVSEIQAAMALLVPPEQRVRRPDPPWFEGRRSVPYGRDWLLVAAGEVERTNLLRALEQAGHLPSALQLDPRAQHCPQAARIARQAIVVSKA